MESSPSPAAPPAPLVLSARSCMHYPPGQRATGPVPAQLHSKPCARASRSWTCSCMLPPPLRTNWTRRVPHPVLIGHAASLGRSAGRHPNLVEFYGAVIEDHEFPVRPPARAPPPPPSRTKWTRLVHPSVLIGHVAGAASDAGPVRTGRVRDVRPICTGRDVRSLCRGAAGADPSRGVCRRPQPRGVPWAAQWEAGPTRLSPPSSRTNRTQISPPSTNRTRISPAPRTNRTRISPRPSCWRAAPAPR